MMQYKKSGKWLSRQVLNLLSDVHVLSRQADRALTDAQSSVQLARQSQNKRVLAQALNYLGNAWMAKTNQASALTAYQEAIQLSESLAPQINHLPIATQ